MIKALQIALFLCLLLLLYGITRLRKNTVMDENIFHNGVAYSLVSPHLAFITSDACWERDYWRELLAAVPTPCKVAIFSSNLCNFETMARLCENERPQVIIHTSDEGGRSPEFYALANETSLVLRQYHHPNYGVPPKNIIHIPLGYQTHMFGGESAKDYLPKASESLRDLTWSFIGNIKQDRQEMMDEMRKQFPDKYHVGHAAPPTMAELYRRSIFVPNGRGNVVLNCFRLYEASACGAIPVLVGNEKEISEEFRYEDSPPWIFASSWSEASMACRRLLESKEDLSIRQNAVIAWWKRRIGTVVGSIQMHLATEH